MGLRSEVVAAGRGVNSPAAGTRLASESVAESVVTSCMVVSLSAAV